jgi:hypothetical protein
MYILATAAQIEAAEGIIEDIIAPHIIDPKVALCNILLELGIILEEKS